MINNGGFCSGIIGLHLWLQEKLKEERRNQQDSIKSENSPTTEHAPDITSPTTEHVHIKIDPKHVPRAQVSLFKCTWDYLHWALYIMTDECLLWRYGD